MQTLEDSLHALYKKNLITREAAIGAANSPESFERRFIMASSAPTPTLGRRRF